VACMQNGVYVPSNGGAENQKRRGVDPGIRSNLVIAMGDLAFRFPNLLEPWTGEMYQPLKDTDKGQWPIRPPLLAINRWER